MQHVLEEQHKFLVVRSLLDGISRGLGGGIEGYRDQVVFKFSEGPFLDTVLCLK